MVYVVVVVSNSFVCCYVLLNIVFVVVLQENLHVRCLVPASFSCAGDFVYVALT